MKKFNFLHLFIVASCTTVSTHANESSYYWLSSITEPTSHTSESIGSYANGCLKGGIALEKDSDGYQLMRLSRERYYTHPNLYQFINHFAKNIKENHPFKGIVVGDTGAAIGGPMPSGHASHQIGLDVDIWLHPAFPNTLSDTERETISAISHVTPQQTIKQSWNDDYTNFVLTAARYSNVSRIFVNPAIKKAICSQVDWEENIDALSKIRPWYGHDAHMHVRLECPQDSKSCINQPKPVRQHGCSGHDIDWWFSDEARNPQPNKTPAPKKSFSDLPHQCQQLYHNLKKH